MKSIEEKQELFFRHLQMIQESVVLTALSEHGKMGSLEDALYSISYDAIYRFLEFIDGYSTDEIKVNLTDAETGITLRKNMELHDKCADYLRC